MALNHVGSSCNQPTPDIFNCEGFLRRDHRTIERPGPNTSIAFPELKVMMKVKQPVASGTQEPQPEIRHEADGPDEAGVESTHSEPDLKAHDQTMLENAQSCEDAHLLLQEEVDLAFERDEMLQPKSHDSHVTSHGPKVWKVKGINLKLSALEATVTVKEGVFTYDDFEV
jgi:hypothetical protein